MPRPTVTLPDVEALKETDAALLCLVEGKEVWIPKSVIDDDSEVWEEGQSGDLVVHEWFATKEGLV